MIDCVALCYPTGVNRMSSRLIAQPSFGSFRSRNGRHVIDRGGLGHRIAALLVLRSVDSHLFVVSSYVFLFSLPMFSLPFLLFPRLS